jgi:hypothetical protein
MSRSECGIKLRAVSLLLAAFFLFWLNLLLKRTEDRGQRTKDRGRRTDDRGQRTKGIYDCRLTIYDFTAYPERVSCGAEPPGFH